jgi:hypothetical protein
VHLRRRAGLPRSNARARAVGVVGYVRPSALARLANR